MDLMDTLEQREQAVFIVVCTQLDSVDIFVLRAQKERKTNSFVYMILLCRYFIIVILRIAYLLQCSCPNELCDCITGKAKAQLHAVYTEWINTHGTSFIGDPNRPPGNIQ